MNSRLIYDFKKENHLTNWTCVNDSIMGGISFSHLSKNEDGLGVFEGEVSLENNGGFSSVRYRFQRIAVGNALKIKIRLKGDGKEYQFRIKDSLEHAYSYISKFSTTTDWEDLIIPLQNLYPVYRGKKLDHPNFSQSGIVQVMFLISNKKKEQFKLLIDKIELI